MEERLQNLKKVANQCSADPDVHAVVWATHFPEVLEQGLQHGDHGIVCAAAVITYTCVRVNVDRMNALVQHGGTVLQRMLLLLEAPPGDSVYLSHAKDFAVFLSQLLLASSMLETAINSAVRTITSTTTPSISPSASTDSCAIEASALDGVTQSQSVHEHDGDAASQEEGSAIDADDHEGVDTTVSAASVLTRVDVDEEEGDETAPSLLDVADTTPEGLDKLLGALSAKQEKSPTVIKESGDGVHAKLTLYKLLATHAHDAARLCLVEEFQVAEVTPSALVDSTVLLLSNASLSYLLVKLRQLLYLGTDLEWWHAPSNAAFAMQLSLVVEAVAEISGLASPEVRHMIGTRLIEPCLDFLRDSQPWHSAARKTPARAKAKAAATSKSADGDGAESAAATSGTAAPAESESLTFPDHATNLSRNVVRIVANACAKCRECQDRVRELRGIPIILSKFLHDDHNPYIREWSTVAIHNLCEGNPENQQEIDRIEATPRSVQNAEEVRDVWGLDVELDEGTGRLKVKSTQRD
eukprot:m.210521 g.210521  ORF g.210521 m.210521 type:complete len:526 (-) comp15051_c1_seq4:167-1744(-)